MSGWALDLGTTNSVLSRWDADAERPRLVELPNVCRKPGRVEPLEAPRAIPSAVHVTPPAGFWDRMGRTAFFLKRAFWGRQGFIGRAALERNQGWRHPQFARGFKPYLGYAPHRTMARTRGTTHSARDVARIFLRELLREAKEVTGERIRDLVVTTPVESYDAYRAELAALGRSVGVDRMRFVDEPVAAAMGYGLGLREARRVLVVDFGGGTLDLAVVELSARELEEGTCRVIAKEGRPVGGDVVDGWLLQAFADEMNVRLQPDAKGGDAELWYRLMLDEARRVKEKVYFEPEATFSISPPAELRGVGQKCFHDVQREDLLAILEGNDLYAILADCADGVARQMKKEGLSEDAIDDVLMVGGSTLLQGVYGVFEERYGRDRVRAWQPFDAVSLGASAFAQGRYGQSDFIVHDYAFVTYDPKTHDKVFTPIVGRGTRFPVKEAWKRQLVPTCSLGEPEKIFSLVVCEVAGGGDRRFAWDAEGNVHRVGGEGEEKVIVPLNESNPAMGHLDPPHPPGDRTPRLEIAFGVDENRWLVARVTDLKSRRTLMDGEPVVRLL